MPTHIPSHIPGLVTATGSYLRRMNLSSCGCRVHLWAFRCQKLSAARLPAPLPVHIGHLQKFLLRVELPQLRPTQPVLRRVQITGRRFMVSTCGRCVCSRRLLKDNYLFVALVARENRVVAVDQAECIRKLDRGAEFAVQIGNRHRVNKFWISVDAVRADTI